MLELIITKPLYAVCPFFLAISFALKKAVFSLEYINLLIAAFKRPVISFHL